MSNQWLALLAFASISFLGAPTFAQGTAFSYQGHLNDNGSPANGIYDLRFTVCDALTNGDILAGPVTNSATGVSNGLFTVTLDFGGGVFTGPARWLQLDVQTNGNGTFTTLLPRQPILPTPYAIMAGTASNLSGTLPASQLSGLAGNFMASNITFTGSITGDGSGLTNLNASAITNLTSLPFVILHPNLTATIYTSGSQSSPGLISFPASQTAGWDEIKALFSYNTNATGQVGFRMIADPGVYPIYSQVILPPFIDFSGAGPAGTIFLDDRPTNTLTLAQMTNGIISNNQNIGVWANSALFLVSTNNVKYPAGSQFFNSFPYVKLANFSIKQMTNAYTYGLAWCGMDSEFDNITVGGPDLWGYPDYQNAWVSFSQVSAPPKMVGFMLGNPGNTHLIMNNCAAVECAVGLANESQGAQITVNTFRAITIGIDANLDGSSAYPPTSEFYVGAGILHGQEAVNSESTLIVDNYLGENEQLPFFAAGAGLVVREVFTENAGLSPNNPAGALIGIQNGVTSGIYTSPESFITQGSPYLMIISNTASGFLFDANYDQNPQFLSQINQGNYITYSFGNFGLAQITKNGFVGPGSGLTSLNVAAMPGITTNYTMPSGPTLYITNGVIMGLH